MAKLEDIKISEEITQPADVALSVGSLSVELKGEDARLDGRIDNLSSELSNYWKIKKDDDPSKTVSEEMDFLMMRAQGNPNVVYKVGMPYQDGTGENMRWKYYGTNLATDFIQSKKGNVDAKEGTSTETIRIG